MTLDLVHLKRSRRHLERVYRSTHSPLDFKILRTITTKYHKNISLAKRTCNSNLILFSISNLHLLWKAINSLLHRNPLRSLPSTKSLSSFPQLFATFFSDKFSNLHINLLSTTSTTAIHFPHHLSHQISPPSPVSPNKYPLLSLNAQSNSYCDLDPIPTSLLKNISSTIAPTILSIVNLSFLLHLSLLS